MSQVNLENYDELSAISFTDTYRGEYILYYMSDKMTEKDALLEMECHSIGGHNPDLYPYYIIIPKKKWDILQRIRGNIYHDGYEDGYAQGELTGHDSGKISSAND